MQEFIASLSLLVLLCACTEVTALKRKRFGIELCKRYCARYNRCYGIRYNITSITCTILNDKNTDGDDMHLTRKEILQSLRPQGDCVASQYFRTRLCIVTNKGHKIDIAETRESLKEALEVTEGWSTSSNHNVVCHKTSDLVFAKEICYIPSRAYPHEAAFGAVIDKDFLPGRRYLNQMRFYQNYFPSGLEVKLLTLSVTNTSGVDFYHNTWNITYTETNKNISVYYYGHDGNATKVNVIPDTIEIVRFLIDRSSSGSFLHDIDMLFGRVRGSIKLPNTNTPFRIALHLYLPANGSFHPPIANDADNVEKNIEEWYKVYYSD